MTNSKEEIINTAGGIRFGRVITQEIIDDYTNRYLSSGWSDVSCVDYLAFTCPDNRWIHMFDRRTDAFTSLDGKWTINLVSTKHEDSSTSSAVSVVQENT